MKEGPGPELSTEEVLASDVLRVRRLWLTCPPTVATTTHQSHCSGGWRCAHLRRRGLSTRPCGAPLSPVLMLDVRVCARVCVLSHRETPTLLLWKHDYPLQGSGPGFSLTPTGHACFPLM